MSILKEFYEIVTKEHADFKIELSTETTSFTEVHAAMEEVHEVKYDVTKITSIADVKTIVSSFKQVIYTAKIEAIYFAYSAKLEAFTTELKKAKTDKIFQEYKVVVLEYSAIVAELKKAKTIDIKVEKTVKQADVEKKIEEIVQLIATSTSSEVLYVKYVSVL